MNNPEAKFLLGAYRPDGRDAHDPAFAEALAQAERDPELRAWLAREQQLDAAVAEKLAALAPPPGLREAILAGARASRQRRHWWTHPAWLAAAAAAIVLLATVAVWWPRAVIPADAPDLASVALSDLAGAHLLHQAHPGALASVQAQLVHATAPLSRSLRLDRAELQAHGCRALSVGGREVFEVCFQREGTWYHLYIARRGDFAPGELQARGDYAAAGWNDGENVFALVTHSGLAALRKLI
jgi:hypothetical protein